MSSTEYIAILGVIIATALYFEQIANILNTGERDWRLTVLLWLVGALTVLAMVVISEVTI